MFLIALRVRRGSSPVGGRLQQGTSAAREVRPTLSVQVVYCGTRTEGKVPEEPLSMQVRTEPEAVQPPPPGHIEPGFAANLSVNFAYHAPAQFVVDWKQM